MKNTIECPYPTVCEYDDYRRSGNHICMRGICPHRDAAKKKLKSRIAYLTSLQKPTPSDLSEIAWCEDLLKKLC